MQGIVIPTESHPLAWPPNIPRTKQPRSSQFRFKAVARGLKLVYEELRRLRAQHPIISSNLPPRQDGLPSVRDKDVDDTGVAVYWVMPADLGAAPYCLPCDRWELVGENLLAIASTIKALRDVERWGAIRIEQAFAGVKALPSGDAPPVADWRTILGGPWPDGLANSELLVIARSRYHKLARLAHPDRDGPSAQAAAAQLNEAMATAEKELSA